MGAELAPSSARHRQFRDVRFAFNLSAQDASDIKSAYPLTAVGNSNWKIEPLLPAGDTQIRPLWLSMIE